MNFRAAMLNPLESGLEESASNVLRARFPYQPSNSFDGLLAITIKGDNHELWTF